MISHDRAQELISARMDTPLTPAEHHELQNHLASCTTCRVFVSHADEIARGMQVMPRLAPSPAVSRAVMSAIATDNSGWAWLRRGLQTLSSPGMAVATSMALVIALASALIVALNAPGGGNNPAQEGAPEGTLAALAVTPLPTEIPPTEPPLPPTEAPENDSSESLAAAPTATRGPVRTVTTRAADKTPTPAPTPTRVPIQSAPAQNNPAGESPAIEPSEGDVPVYEAPADDSTLAMASEEAADAAGSVDIAQEADPAVVEEQPAENTDTGEAVDAAPSESEPVTEPESDNSGQKNEGNKKDDSGEATTEEPLPTRPVGPLPAEAIAALEGAGPAPDIYLPPPAPEPLDPTLPDQSFLPVTPTPVVDGTPTPETAPATEAESPQLAEEWSGDLGVAALAPEAPAVAEAPDETVVESEEIKEKGKKDKSSKDGKSHEQQQSASDEQPMAWSTQPIELPESVDLQQTAAEPADLQQTTEYPVDASSTTGQAVAPAADPATTTEPVATEPARQIDPATGMEIDPETGYLIDPTTGYLLDRVNGRIIDPRTSFEVHPMTGLLIDPATGAMLDPNTLAVVIPPGFGSDQPAYVPGSDEMHGDIETVVDDTYDNASIKLEPPTDGPVQPVGEIVVPTESGEALEIS